MDKALDHRVGYLEDVMAQLAHEHVKTEIELRNLSKEMYDFKNEMKDFKDEMKDFKDEMRDFKDEMKQSNQEMNKRWGDLANKMGTIVEDIVAPNLPRVGREDFGLGDEPDDFMIHRHKRKVHDFSKRREFDALAIYSDAVIVNETKSSPNVEKVDGFKKMLSELLEYYPEFEGKKIIPIFSSLSLSKEIINYLSRQKIYGLAMNEDTMVIVNKDEIEDEWLGKS